jgi:hypothetical protein
MDIEIDQSGKVENTSKQTILAFCSVSKVSSISLSAKDKKRIQRVFRREGKPQMFTYRVFARLIYLLVEPHLKEIKGFGIDLEYPGWSHLIKDYLLQDICEKYPRYDKNLIYFFQVGKKSLAHVTAYETATGMIKPDIVAKYNQVLDS